MKAIPVVAADRPAIVDDEDYPVLSRLKWRLSLTTGWIITPINNINVQMNRLIMGQRARKNLLVVYKNGDHFDNRKENLEIWVPSAYAKHTRRGRTCTSRYRGVFYHRPMNKWCTKPVVNRKRIGVYYFDDETEAAKAYIRIMAQNGNHYTLDDLLAKKRRVEDYRPLLAGRDVIVAA